MTNALPHTFEPLPGDPDRFDGENANLTLSAQSRKQTDETYITYSDDFYPITNQGFLLEIFRAYITTTPCIDDSRPQVLAFKMSPADQKNWGGQRWQPEKEISCDDRNGYFTLAVYKSETETKQEKDCVAICGLMLDDIGTKALPLSRLDALPPSYVIETSEGNYQAGYLFDRPQTDLKACAALNQALVDSNLCDSGAKSPATRWGRLPFASNTKRDPVFKCRLVEFDSTRRYSIEQIVTGLELVIKENGRPKPTKAKKLRTPGATIDDRGDDVYRPRASENEVISALKSNGLYKRPLGSGKHEITCPWVSEHTDQVDHGTVYFEPNDLYTAGGFHCQHSHGSTKKIGALLDFLSLNYQQAKHKSTIMVVAGELHRIVDTAEKELALTGKYYQRGGLISCVNTDPTTLSTEIVPLKSQALVRALSSVAVWERFDARSEQFVVTDPPSRHAQILFESMTYAHLPPLAGLARQPFLRSDCSLVNQAGYDQLTGLFGVFDERDFNVQARPTREQALAALQELNSLLTEFAFATPTDKTAALAGILTAALRPSLEQAPMFHIKAPQIASGKSYLTSLIAAFASETPPSALGFPGSDEEAEKLLLSCLMTAPAAILFDNLTTDIIPFKKLCSSLTEPHVEGRILGFSKNATVGTRVLFLSSGNNVSPVRDMTRRCIVINLDPMVECPAAREFKADPLREVRTNRGKYVSAAMTIVLAWIQAGRPITKCKTLNSYGQWRDLVTQPLMWLGEPDPATGVFEQMANDPDTELLGRLLVAWQGEFGRDYAMVREAVKASEGIDKTELREVLNEVAEQRGEINRRRLGNWIARHTGRIVGGLRFEKDSSKNSAERWSARQVKSVISVISVSNGDGGESVRIEKSHTEKPDCEVF